MHKHMIYLDIWHSSVDEFNNGFLRATTVSRKHQKQTKLPKIKTIDTEIEYKTKI